MAALVNFNDNCSDNTEFTEQNVVWVGASLHPTEEGHYFTKLITLSGEIIKSATTYEGFKWHLGSGELFGIKVHSWLDDRK